MVFVTILSAGLPLTISKYTASDKVSNNKSHTYSIVSSGLKIEILISIILVLLIFIFKPLFITLLGYKESYYLLLSMIPAILATAIYSPFKGYLWGEEKYFRVSIVEFIEQIIKILLLIIFTTLNMNISSLLPIGITISISCVLSTIIGITFYFAMGGRLNIKSKQYKEILSSSIPLTTTRFFGSLIHPTISIILPFMLISIGYTKSQALSMLGIAMGMTFPLLTIPSTLIGSLSMVLIPEIASMLESGNTRSMTRQINSSVLFTICCSFICIPILMGLSEPICMLLFNNIEAGIYLKYSAWTILPTGLSSISTSILNSLGKEKYTFKYFIISTIITIIIIFTAPLFAGIHSLFIALGVGMTITFILNNRMINKTLNIKHTYIKQILILLLITIPTTLLSMWLYNIFLIMYGNLFALIISATITLMCFVLLLISFNIIDIRIIFENISNRKVKTH